MSVRHFNLPATAVYRQKQSQPDALNVERGIDISVNKQLFREMTQWASISGTPIFVPPIQTLTQPSIIQITANSQPLIEFLNLLSIWVYPVLVVESHQC